MSSNSCFYEFKKRIMRCTTLHPSVRYAVSIISSSTYVHVQISEEHCIRSYFFLCAIRWQYSHIFLFADIHSMERMLENYFHFLHCYYRSQKCRSARRPRHVREDNSINRKKTSKKNRLHARNFLENKVHKQSVQRTDGRQMRPYTRASSKW